MQIYSKNNKNCFFSLISWPIFILFVLSDRARWRLQNWYTQFWNSLIMLIYAHLRSPGRDPGVQSAFFFFFFFFHYYYYYLFFHVPSGASNVYFLTSRILYHMKFAIFDVARCRMSATSLTFLLFMSILKATPFRKSNATPLWSIISICLWVYIYRVGYHLKAWLFGFPSILHLSWLLCRNVRRAIKLGSLSKYKCCKIGPQL